MALLQAGARLGGAKLWYDRSTQRFFLLIQLAIATPDPTPARTPQIVGIDVGSHSPLYRGNAGQQGPVLFGKGDTSAGGPLRKRAKRLEPQGHVGAHAPQNRARPGRRDGHS
jgi:hypothetical protein